MYIRSEDAQNYINRRLDTTFISKNGIAKVTVPTNRLFELSSALSNWNDVKWMCIQTSFMLANPVAGFAT